LNLHNQSSTSLDKSCKVSNNGNKEEAVMIIQILGTGCPKCKQLEANAREAIAKVGLAAEVEKISDIDKIMDMGVMMTPALAVDGEVKSVGRVLTVDQVISTIGGTK
jgi:small redox-active disulfide protein 2